MNLNYPVIAIDYHRLNSLYLPTNVPFELKIEWNGVKFEFLIKINPNSSHLLVMGSGAMNFTETRMKPPFYQRHSWMNDFEDSVIYYNDPTLYLDDHLLVGWGQGTKDRFYIKEIAIILEQLLNKMQIPPKNVLFYGSSAGGFMAFILAGYIKESKALVNSPQTSLAKWLPVPVQQVFDLSYPNHSFEEVLNLYPERTNVIKFYQSIMYVPKIYYLQNAYCELDIKDHLLPFIEGLQQIGQGCTVNQVKVDLYYIVQPGPAVLPALGGHGALGKIETINYINKMKTEF